MLNDWSFDAIAREIGESAAALYRSEESRTTKLVEVAIAGTFFCRTDEHGFEVGRVGYIGNLALCFSVEAYRTIAV